MTLEEKGGLLFHSAIAVPDAYNPEKEAVKVAESHIAGKHLSHFNVPNGDGAAEIAAWTNRLQDIAAGTRLGIPVTVSSDPRSGFRCSPFTGEAVDDLSRWPEHTGLAAINSTDTVRSYADTVRREFLAMGIRVYLGPMADLFSEPRWSRGYGTFGEDPETASRLTAAFIEGLRGGTDLGLSVSQRSSNTSLAPVPSSTEMMPTTSVIRSRFTPEMNSSSTCAHLKQHSTRALPSS
ncbi:glycoside hydrolase family 3 protein [Arthrobacter sp. ISL-85]|nr:glycoside hydrolase family 3 protein [Arthrobacter sp. ISL-85]